MGSLRRLPISVALALAWLLVAAATAGAQTAPQKGTFDRPVTGAGVNAVIWNGGTVDQLTSAASAVDAVSVTAYAGGQAVVLIPQAPAFVNSAFRSAFPVEVSGGTIVFVVRPTAATVPTAVKVPVGASGYGADVAITPDGSKALVTTNRTAGTVTVISLADYSTVAVIPVDPFPSAIAISADGTTALVNHGTRITVINVVTNSVVGTVTNPCLATGSTIAVSPDGTRTVAPMTGSWDATKGTFCNRAILGSISTSPATLTEGAPLVVGGTEVPLGVAITPDNRTALVTLGGAGSSIRTVDLASNTASTIGATGATYGVTVVPDGSAALIVGANSIERLSLATGALSVAATFRAGYGLSTSVHGIAVSPDGRQAVGVGTNQFGVLSLTTGVFTSISADGGDNVAITPDGLRAVVTTPYGYMRVWTLP